MSIDDERYSPELAQQGLEKEKQQAYQHLLSRLGPVRRTVLRWIYRRITLFAGTRKHVLVLFGYAVRKAALRQGDELVRNNRLHAAEEVFDLTFADLEAAVGDSARTCGDAERSGCIFTKN